MRWRLAGLIGLGLAGAAFAAETITYSYDARGRIKTVVRTGTVNNGVSTSYTHDRADNRPRVVVTGSSGTPPP